MSATTWHSPPKDSPGAFPLLPLFRDTPAQLKRLLEMRADDSAARIHNRLTVASALLSLAEHPTARLSDYCLLPAA